MLARISRQFEAEVALLAALFDAQLGNLSADGVWASPSAYAAQSYAVMRLHDAWSRFCRTLVLTSSTGRARTTVGYLVPRSPIVPVGARPIDVLRSRYPGPVARNPVWEPSWHLQPDALNAAQNLRVQNYATISGSLSPASVAIADLRACRNFLAHRGGPRTSPSNASGNDTGCPPPCP